MRRERGPIKLSKGGLTISTRKLRSYPGDNSVQIMLTTERDVTVPFINLWPTTVRGMRMWESTRGGNFWTIAEAKRYALDRALKDRSEAKRKRR